MTDILSEVEQDTFERYALCDVKSLISGLFKHIEERHVAPSIITESGEVSEGRKAVNPHILNDANRLESTLHKYADEWGDSQELRHAILHMINDLDTNEPESLPEYCSVLSEVISSGFPPAALLASVSMTRKAMLDAVKAMGLSQSSRGFLPSRPEIFAVWLEALHSAYADLGLEGIPAAPVEVFKEFLEPYTNRLVHALFSQSYGILTKRPQRTV